MDRARTDRRENKIQQDHLGPQGYETGIAVNPIENDLFFSLPLCLSASLRLCGESLLVLRGSQPDINRHREGGDTGFPVAVVKYLRA